jgi:L,D-peptidoglycan transpeptidase YkuD (ErfK/YbiS/YcfS/YnhG family)
VIRGALVGALAVIAMIASGVACEAPNRHGVVTDPGSGSGSGPVPQGPLAHSTQLVTAVIDDWHATRATLRLWRRATADAAWQPVGEPWPGVIGRGGAAWPAARKEGDGTSPAGAFALDATYGYASAPPPGAKLPYTQTDASWLCVDDARSSHYAQIVDQRATPVDWQSAEVMHRDDELYTWVVDVAFNREHTPSAGSCIFLHVWRGPDSPTIGCTAMPELALARVIAALDPTAAPRFVLLPRAEYDAHATAWGLPPR